MPVDLLIKNGLVVDGTGAPGRHAEVAIAGRKIAEIGKLDGIAARETIDAADCVVAPGFIDPHTHYDAQICWDGAVTPSSWHGVTSVVMGNCGVGIAPCAPRAREIAMRDLVNVEAFRSTCSTAASPGTGRVFRSSSMLPSAASPRST